MKTLFIAALCVAFSTIGFAQESLFSFNQISVTGSIKLTLKKADKPEYSTSGDTDNLKIRVEDGKLKITRLDIADGWKNPTYVTVWYTDLRELSAGAGAEFSHEGTLNAGDLALTVSAGAHGDLIIDAQSLDVKVGEGGVLRLEGVVRVVEASASTGAVLKARDLIAHRVFITTDTGAAATVHATEEINANATLGGSVTYSGDPEIVKVKESLGGSVRG